MPCCTSGQRVSTINAAFASAGVPAACCEDSHAANACAPISSPTDLRSAVELAPLPLGERSFIDVGRRCRGHKVSSPGTPSNLKFRWAYIKAPIKYHRQTSPDIVALEQETAAAMLAGWRKKLCRPSKTSDQDVCAFNHSRKIFINKNPRIST